ncbi:hypothetical protein K435DRAFT_850389 [Dendrothele bispora CBS 962.96]|uniref:DUF423-domain-containing protein n=1 Tax=Dendrothele bispora (strain CBS 962.96) TaxID=1314807 RepID=A0A4S8MPB1_DENBC|nr:hypothetical protein K435DRAFT_850389 [Dendrothele bispora CBS 962.96]
MTDSSSPLIPRSMNSMPRSSLWRTGAIFVAVGMIAGAFGAHGLKNRSNISRDSIDSWMTASHYAVFNGLGLFAVSLHPRFAAHRFAPIAISVGGAVFSSSIYLLVSNRDRFKFLGPVTPLGGLTMILGYLSLAL